MSDSNTEDRKTHKELGVGSGAAPSLVCEPEGDAGGVRGGGDEKEVEGEEEHQTTLMRLSPESHAQSSRFHHFSLSFLFLMAE